MFNGNDNAWHMYIPYSDTRIIYFHIVCNKSSTIGLGTILYEFSFSIYTDFIYQFLLV